jgi:hydroxymethylglutaryl-CoA reductase (NADPH)
MKKMPVPHDQAKRIAERLTRGRDVSGLPDLLAPTPESERSLPPPVPRQVDWSEEAAEERINFLEARGNSLDHLKGSRPLPDREILRTRIENFIGMAQIPVGVIGPLRINGLHASGDFYVPLATSEGALVASCNRGAGLLSRAGGAATLTTIEHVQRAPGFVFRRMAESALFALWASEAFPRFVEIAKEETTHGQLLDLSVQIQGNHVYLILDFHTGDAAGQNMVTFCTAAICEYILQHSPYQPSSWFVESNMSGDKKATALGFSRTRGRNATAEAVIPRELLRKILRTTPECMCEYWRLSFIGGVQTGSIGVSGHLANSLAALFIACGQDVACVSEASVGLTRLETTSDGDLYAMVNLPNLIVGTVGGGTELPTAQECLRIMGCEGEGTAAKFAEICAAVALGGELSIIGALCANEFSKAHRKLGRKR